MAHLQSILNPGLEAATRHAAEQLTEHLQPFTLLTLSINYK